MKIEKTFIDKNVFCARPNIIPVQKNWIQKSLAVQIELASRRQRVWEFPTIFRKEVLKKTGGWDERIDFAEDRELPVRIKKLGYKSVLIRNAVVYTKPVNSVGKLLRQGRWYGRNIVGYFKRTRDFTTLFGVLVYSSFVPFVILSFLHHIFLLASVFDLGVLFIYSLKGFLLTRSLYAFLMIPINVVRGFGELVGIVERVFKKGRGRS